MLHEEEVSQRAIADMVGVGKSTINRDIVPDGPTEKDTITDIQDITDNTVPDGPPQSGPVNSGDRGNQYKEAKSKDLTLANVGITYDESANAIHRRYVWNNTGYCKECN